MQPLAWWQVLWAAALGRVEAPAVKVTPVRTVLVMQGEAAADAAGLPSPSIEGYTPGKDVIPVQGARNAQGVLRTVDPQTETIRSPQQLAYIRAGYQAWEPQAPRPVPVPYYVVDRVQVPPHPVFERPPVPVLQRSSGTIAYA